MFVPNFKILAAVGPEKSFDIRADKSLTKKKFDREKEKWTNK